MPYGYAIESATSEMGLRSYLAGMRTKEIVR